VRRDDYLEGKTNVALSDYSKFSQIATFEVGMTPQEMHEGVQDYLSEYPTEDYAYLKMLDILQQLVDNGFELWIITGSNPYFIASLLNDIDETLGYELLAASCVPDDPDLEQCQIAGNAAKQSPDGRFTIVYDDRFVRLSGRNNPFFLERNIVDGEGKEIAIRNYIEEKRDKPVVFYAGNSGGDYEAIEYVLDQEELDTLAVAVNPKGTLTDLVVKYEPYGQLVKVLDSPAQP
jgi:phosphoserine phosphatase